MLVLYKCGDQSPCNKCTNISGLITQLQRCNYIYSNSKFQIQHTEQSAEADLNSFERNKQNLQLMHILGGSSGLLVKKTHCSVAGPASVIRRNSTT
jgi:hypothetical protein